MRDLEYPFSSCESQASQSWDRVVIFRDVKVYPWKIFLVLIYIYVYIYKYFHYAFKREIFDQCFSVEGGTKLHLE